MTKETLQPIVDLFSGADGGVGFAQLAHHVLPQLVELAAAGNEIAQSKLDVITEFSRMCKVLLK